MAGPERRDRTGTWRDSQGAGGARRAAGRARAPPPARPHPALCTPGPAPSPAPLLPLPSRAPPQPGPAPPSALQAPAPARPRHAPCTPGPAPSPAPTPPSALRAQPPAGLRPSLCPPGPVPSPVPPRSPASVPRPLLSLESKLLGSPLPREQRTTPARLHCSEATWARTTDPPSSLPFHPAPCDILGTSLLLCGAFSFPPASTPIPTLSSFPARCEMPLCGLNPSCLSPHCCPKADKRPSSLRQRTTFASAPAADA
jgi:hypothetical protein